MKIYGLSQQAVERQKRRALLRGWLFLLPAVALPITVMYAAGFITAWMVPVILPLLVIMVAMGVKRGLKMTEENLSSYRLLLGDEVITRQQTRVPEVEIPYDRITAVKESALTGLVIKTADRNQTIYVPTELDDYAEVKTELFRRKPQAVPFVTRGLSAWLLFVPTILFLGAFAALWLSRSLAVVLGAGIFIMVYWLWAWTLVRRRQDIDARVKLGVWHLVVGTLCFAAMTYARVMALRAK